MTTTSPSERVIPRLGQTVFYRLSELDVKGINRRREDAKVSADIAAGQRGLVVHFGNAAHQGEVFPMVITKIWASDPGVDTAVQGQVMLDGNDLLWVTSVRQGDGEREWSATAP